MNRMVKSFVVIAGHGSRVAVGNAEFEEYVRRYQARRPDLDVSFGYIELAQPFLEEALRRKAGELDDLVRRGDIELNRTGRIRLIPLFLFASGHVKNDIPLILRNIRSDFPNIDIVAARPIGVHPAALAVVCDRASAVLATLNDPLNERDDTVIVMVGRGSGDPDANGDFCKICRLLGEQTSAGARKVRWVLPCFIGITDPRLVETLEAAAKFNPVNIVVVPYFLFDGTLLNRIRDQIEEFRKRTSGIKVHFASHLGIDDRLFEITDERVAETAADQS